MQIDNALILAAGFGTRMGVIGELLPKVIWPIYNKSLLELQVLYLRELGVKRIFINLHFQKERILTDCKNKDIFNDVIFLEEEEILGVGGAIHNLARHKEISYQGNLLLINADQFSFFDKEIWREAYLKLESYPCSLFATYVEKRFKYNETVIDDKNLLVKILPKGEQTAQTHLTYSGFGFVNLSKIKPEEGKSDFFKSIADYNNLEIPMTILPEDFEYWDFGTKERYLSQIYKLKNSDSDFSLFLKRNDCVVNEFFYQSYENINGVSLEGKKIGAFPPNISHFIHYKDIVDPIVL